MKKFLLGVLFVFCIPLYAEDNAVTMRITKEREGKIPSSIVKPSEMSAVGQELFKIMKNDLSLSGWIDWPATQAEVDRIAKGTDPKQVRSLASWQRIGTQIVIKTALEIGPDGEGTFDVFVYHTDKGDRLFAKRYRFSKTQLRSAVHVAVDNIIQRLTGETGIASTKIAYMLDHLNGRKEIYICDYDGSRIYQLTSDHSVALGPDWAPDAKSLLYTSFKDQFSRIYIQYVHEGKRARLASYPGLNASAKFSPKGDRLALVLSKDGNPEVYLSDLQGKNLERLTNRKGVDTSPAWSPDGSRIAFVSDRRGRPHIYIINLKDGSVEALTRSGRYNVSPDWSPKGDKIAFCSDMDGTFRIYVADLIKGNMYTVSPEGVHAEEPDWAPDNRHLVYSGKTKGVFSLYVVNTVTGEVRLLLTSGGSYLTPAWSS